MYILSKMHIAADSDTGSGKVLFTRYQAIYQVAELKRRKTIKSRFCSWRRAPLALPDCFMHPAGIASNVGTACDR